MVELIRGEAEGFDVGRKESRLEGDQLVVGKIQEAKTRQGREIREEPEELWSVTFLLEEAKIVSPFPLPPE